MKTLLPALLLLGLLATSCDDKKSDFKHTPPAGQGSLIVDNQTTARFEIYVDGAKLWRVGILDDKAFDLKPGLHRVVVDEYEGRRGKALDVDILEGKRTVLRMEEHSLWDSSLRIRTYLDN